MSYAMAKPILSERSIIVPVFCHFVKTKSPFSLSPPPMWISYTAEISATAILHRYIHVDVRDVRDACVEMQYV